jgi:hypothetical protein
MDFSALKNLTQQKKAALKPKEKTIKPVAGTNRFVILQGWRKGEEHVWFHEFGQHYIKDAAGQIQAVYPCADKTYGTPCAVCAGIAQAQSHATEDAVINMLKEAGSKQGFVLNVLALDTDTPNEPQVLEVGKGIFSDLNSLMEDWAEALLDDSEPQIVVIERTGKGLNTRYSVNVSPKKIAMPKGAMEKRRNLDEFVAQESEEQERRALGAIRTVSGLLPAPAARPASVAATGEAEAGRVVESARASASLESDLDDLLADIPQ